MVDPEQDGVPQAERGQATDADVDWRDKYLRLLAEQENHRKRLAQQFDRQCEQQKIALLRDLLLIVDNLERALTFARGGHSETELQRGVALTLQEFLKTLQLQGVQRMKTVGQPFDPERHEAAGLHPNPRFPPGAVVQEQRPGYTYHDRLLRPAVVLVTPG